MSFRELRTFTETMRMLGYDKTVSVESFRTPNVELVADIMYWLCKRYDPTADIVYEIDHEGDRVMFFRRICETIHAKARLKLNMKKLYQSDGYAVQEMLKLALLLKQGTLLRTEEDGDYTQLQAQVAQRGHQEAKLVRQLCTELTAEGSSLFHLVESEVKNRAQRDRIMTRATEIGDFERRLRDLVTSVGQQVESTQQQLLNLNGDETNLEQKIENKKAQLDRAQKRLKSLLAVRPAFMEEYEKFEAELHQQFVVYLEQYRNLEYLESQLAKFNRIEDEQLAEQDRKLKVMREKLRQEELKVLRGETVPDDGANMFMGDAQQAAQKAAEMNRTRQDNSRGDGKRPRAASGRTRPSGADQAAAMAARGAAQMMDSDESGGSGVSSDDSDASDSDSSDSDSVSSVSDSDDDSDGDSDGDSDDSSDDDDSDDDDSDDDSDM